MTYIHEMYRAEKYKLVYEQSLISQPGTKLNALIFFPQLIREGQVGQKRLGKWVLKSQRIQRLWAKLDSDKVF